MEAEESDPTTLDVKEPDKWFCYLLLKEAPRVQVFLFPGGSFQDGRVEIKRVKLPFDPLCQFPSFHSVRWISRRAWCHQPLPDPVSKRKKRNGATPTLSVFSVCVYERPV